MGTIPSFAGTKSTPGCIYVVEFNEAAYSFDSRLEALEFADENNCFLVEGIKLA